MNYKRIGLLSLCVFVLMILIVLLFHNQVNMLKQNNVVIIFFSLLIFMVFIILGAYIFKRCCLNQNGSLNPKQIAMLYAENKSIIEQLSEAIISVDKDCNITTINTTSKQMFGLSEDDLFKKSFDVFPFIDFEIILQEEKQRFNRLIEIESETMLVSYFPLYNEGSVIGASAIFKSRLEVDMLLDQISGYQKISKALREQKHEFQNKLHVILGLIKLKDYETVQNYISENVYTTNLTSDYYSSRIKDDKISALFVGKEIQSKEYDVNIVLSSDSILSKDHHPINSDDLIIVIGNLIDNSFEAFGRKDIDQKKITVSINESQDDITISVIDNAGGIDDSVIDTMFNRGISTKEGGYRGTGLSLVKELIKLYSGTKEVNSSTQKTEIKIKLMKVKI